MFKAVFQGILQIWIGLTIVYYGQTLLPSSAEELEQEYGITHSASSLHIDSQTQTLPQFINKMVHFRFGNSLTYKKTVLQVILEHLPFTLILATLSVLISAFISIPLGAFLAQRIKASLIYRFSNLVLSFLASIPTLISAPFFLWLFGLKVFHFPLSYNGGISSYFLPILSISVGLIGSLTLLTRTAFEKTLPQNFVRTAYAKGASKKLVIFKHVFANTIVPIFSFLLLKFSYLLAGSLVVESIYGWPGLGELLSKSIFSRDLPVLQATVLFILLISVFFNTIRSFLLLRFSHEA